MDGNLAVIIDILSKGTANRKTEFIPPPEIKCHLTCFEPATSEEVRKLILTSPTMTCALDPIPTSLLKSFVDVLLIPITTIINLSLKSGDFPDTLKLLYYTAVEEIFIIEG